MGETAVRQVTLRIPAAVHQRAQRIAAKEGTSLNRYALEALEQAMARAEYEELKAAYEAIADDDDILAEDYFHLVKEAVGRDE